MKSLLFMPRRQKSNYHQTKTTTGFTSLPVVKITFMFTALMWLSSLTALKDQN